MDSTSPTLPEARNLLAELVRDAESLPLVWQAAVIAAAFAAAWWVTRRVHARLELAAKDAKPEERALKLGAGSLERVVFPLLVWGQLLIGRTVVEHWFPARLLDIVVPLASSLVIIRIVVYMLRHAFPVAGWLRTSERALAWTVWAGVGLHVTGLLPRLRAALGEVILPIGKNQISALNVIEGTLAVIVTMLAVLWLGQIAEARLMGLGRVDASLRVVLSKLVKAVLIVVGLLTALSLVGIDITVLSVFGGALGVGLGFGLQKIAANYVSGFAILLDRSVKLGDLVTIDGQYGELTRLTARYVVLRAVDGTESIIPNETVITSTVVNHSYTDRRVRVECTVQVAYSADVREAMKALEETARRHPRVLADPAPMAVVKGFGESGIDLELYMWIADPEAGKGNLRSDVNLLVLDAFRARNIEIPFPQRDLRILSGGPSAARSESRSGPT